MNHPVSVKPLKGDEHGHFRVHLVGNSGVGKSTTGKELARILGVPFISLDTIFWTPGWKKRPNDEFRAMVADILAKAENGWVADGNYTNATGGMLDAAATDIVWLDPPFALYFTRIVWRTLGRLFRLTPPCSPGCEESWKEAFFSRESILWWCITQHPKVQTRMKKAMAEDDPRVGGPGKFIRLGGWGGELNAWMSYVRATAFMKED